MELVEGGTLRELLVERGPMPPHAVAAVLRPVLGGLAVAHHEGLVHRDVKPENVLISDGGDVKIADFGLVRAIAEAKITSTSVILGTAAYLSPEQVSTGDAGPASDVYAVGILTYELLTGTTPFKGDSALTVAYQRMDNDVAAPSTVIGGVPKQFDELVLRATAREPGRPLRRCRGHGDPNSTRSSTSWGCPTSGYPRRATRRSICRRNSPQPRRPASHHRDRRAAAPPRQHTRSSPAAPKTGTTTSRQPRHTVSQDNSRASSMDEFYWPVNAPSACCSSG